MADLSVEDFYIPKIWKYRHKKMSNGLMRRPLREKSASEQEKLEITSKLQVEAQEYQGLMIDEKIPALIRDKIYSC